MGMESWNHFCISGARESHLTWAPHMPSPCEYSPPPFKTCAYVFALLCFKATADTSRQEPAAPVVRGAWGEGLQGSGGPRSIALRAVGRPSLGSQARLLLKPCKKTCHRNSSPGFPFLAIPLRAEPLVYLVGEVHSHS